MKIYGYFESRKIDMRKKVATLITYSLEYPEKEEEIISFLIMNDFLVKESICQIKEKKEIKRWSAKKDFELLFDIINIHLISILNSFIEPLPFKDRLQKEKNKKLVSFCKKVLKDDIWYKRLANLA